jgi:nucleotide-binding universal stress UspA family protein
MFDKILVPLDGSELAEAIVPHAEAVADRHQAEVILLQVLSAKRVNPERAAKERHESEDYLMGVEQRLLEKGMNARYTIRHGSDPAAEIVDYAEVNKVDLIAMSTHGRSGMSRWLFGSVASRVLQGTSKPILLIRSAGARISQT